MSDVLVYALSYNMLIICWLQECGLLPMGCDLILQADSEEFISRARESGRFGNIFVANVKNSRGETYLHRELMVQQILENPGRAFRRKSAYLDLMDIGNFYLGTPSAYREYSVPQGYFHYPHPGTVYFQSRRQRVLFSVWEHGITEFQFTTMHYFSSHHANAKSLALGLMGLEQPSLKVERLYVSRPELLDARITERLDVRKVPAMDLNDECFRRDMNRLFSYDREKRRSYREHPVIVLPLAARSDPDSMRRGGELLKQIGEIVGPETMLLKPHPGASRSELETFKDYAVFSRQTIPLELSLLNLPDLDRRLIVGFYISLATLTPKLFFDAEPYMLILDDIFPFPGIYSYINEKFVIRDRVGALYRNPEKFLVPKTVEEALAFVKNYRESEM